MKNRLIVALLFVSLLPLIMVNLLADEPTSNRIASLVMTGLAMLIGIVLGGLTASRSQYRVNAAILSPFLGCGAILLSLVFYEVLVNGSGIVRAIAGALLMSPGMFILSLPA